MKRQNDRIKNILKVKTDNLKSAEKRLADAMSKKRTVAAEKMRSGKTKSREELRSGLMMDLDIKVRTNEAKHAIEVFKKERSNLAKDERDCAPGARKENLRRLLQKKSAELGAMQARVTESETGFEHPVSSKKLPLKDVAEAREMIKFLFEQLCDKASKEVLQEKRAETAVSAQTLFIAHLIKN